MKIYCELEIDLAGEDLGECAKVLNAIQTFITRDIPQADVKTDIQIFEDDDCDRCLCYDCDCEDSEDCEDCDVKNINVCQDDYEDSMEECQECNCERSHDVSDNEENIEFGEDSLAKHWELANILLIHLKEYLDAKEIRTAKNELY